MIFGGGTFEKWFGHEGGPLMNEISAFVKKTPERFLTLLPCESVAIRWSTMSQEDGPHQTLSLRLD